MDANQEHEITKAIAAHGLWKARLKTAIENGTSEFDVATIGRDDRCDFGKWLHGGASPEIQASAHYQSCRGLHAEFHQFAAEILRLALAGQKESAEAKMATQSDFARVSAKLVHEMSDWKHAA